MTQREIFTSQVKFETREQPGRALPALIGYAMTWGQPGSPDNLSDDRGGYRVRLLPHSGRLDNHADCMALCNHNYEQVLGRTSNGTLKVFPDETGMKVEIDPADTTYARDLVTLIRRGDVTGMSFGMLTEGAKYQEVQENGQTIRNYSAFTFDEVSVTPIPAFTATTIESEFARQKMQAEDAADPEAQEAALEVEIEANLATIAAVIDTLIGALSAALEKCQAAVKALKEIDVAEAEDEEDEGEDGQEAEAGGELSKAPTPHRNKMGRELKEIELEMSKLI